MFYLRKYQQKNQNQDEETQLSMVIVLTALMTWISGLNQCWASIQVYSGVQDKALGVVITMLWWFSHTSVVVCSDALEYHLSML